MRRLLAAAVGAIALGFVLVAPAASQQAQGSLTEVIAAGAPLVSAGPGASAAGAATGAAGSDRGSATGTTAALPRSRAADASATPASVGVPGQPDLLLLPDPGAWVGDLVDAIFTRLGQAIVDAIRGFTDWAHGLGSSSLNFITRTPPEGSYASASVRSLWEISRGVANAALALLVGWGGFNVIVRQHTRSPYDGAMELLPRIVLAALAANLTLEFARVLIDANNALSAAVGASGLPGYAQAGVPATGIAAVLVAIAYSVVALLLAFQMLMRLALIDVLIVLAPVMVLLWAIPQAQGWTRWWTHLFPITVFQQAVQMVTLRLGAMLMVELTPGSTASGVLTLFLGIAVCWLTLKIPALLHGQPHRAGMGAVVSLVVVGRAIGALGGGAAASAASGRGA